MKKIVALLMLSFFLSACATSSPSKESVIATAPFNDPATSSAATMLSPITHY